MMNKKAQAAMEFLMTYGWAILVVLLAIGALAYFGVLSPQKLLPERTTFAAPLPNLDNAVIDAATNSIAIAFKNNKGVPINITGVGNLTPADSSTVCDVSSIESSPTGIISNGENFIVTWNCSGTSNAKSGEKFKAELWFQYTNMETTQNLKQTGSVDGKY